MAPASHHGNRPLPETLKHAIHPTYLVVYVLFVEGEKGEGFDVFVECGVCIEGEFGLEVFEDFLEEGVLLYLFC